MMDVVNTVFEFVIFTVVVKGIVAHTMANYIVKYAKLWLRAQPHRIAYYEALLQHYRTAR